MKYVIPNLKRSNAVISKQEKEWIKGNLPSDSPEPIGWLKTVHKNDLAAVLTSDISKLSEEGLKRLRRKQLLKGNDWNIGKLLAPDLAANRDRIYGETITIKLERTGTIWTTVPAFLPVLRKRLLSL